MQHRNLHEDVCCRLYSLVSGYLCLSRRNERKASQVCRRWRLPI